MKSDSSNLPLVSIVMSVYNTQDFLIEAYQSIIAQSYNNLEILIVDDFSSDRSWEVLKTFSDSRVRLFRNKKNIGPSSKNRCIRKAKGKYIAIQDADDVSATNRIEKQVKFLESHPDYYFCSTQMEYFPSGNISIQPSNPEEIKAKFFFKMATHNGPMMIRKAYFEETNNYFDENWPKYIDFKLYSIAILQYKFGIVDEVLYKARKHSSNTTKNNDWALSKEVLQFSLQRFNRIGVEANEKESRMFSYTIFYKPFVGIVETKIALEIFDKAKAGNEKIKLYDSIIFNKYIRDYSKDAINHLGEFNPVIFFKLLQSKGFSNIPLFWQLKFLVKCFLFHRPVRKVDIIKL